MCIGKMIGKCYCGFCCLCNFLQSPLLLFFRLVWGFLFLQAGWGKFTGQGIHAVAEYFSSLHIPYPYFSATLVASVETIGGILLIIGFLSRLASLFLLITMITAYMTAHHPAVAAFFQNPHLILEQGPWSFLVATAIILAFGPGFFSIDRWWQSCCRKCCCCCGKTPCCCSPEHRDHCSKHGCCCCGKNPCICSIEHKEHCSKDHCK